MPPWQQVDRCVRSSRSVRPKFGPKNEMMRVHMRLWFRRLPKSVLKCVDDGLMWRWCETEMVRSPEKRPEFCVWVWSARAMVPTYLEKPKSSPKNANLPKSDLKTAILKNVLKYAVTSTFLGANFRIFGCCEVYLVPQQGAREIGSVC